MIIKRLKEYGAKTITIMVVVFLFIVVGCSEDKAGMDLPEFLEAEIPKLMEQNKVPGAAIAIIHQGQIKWAEGFGYADVKQKIEVDENTIFQVASNSKSVAALGIMKLIEQGRLELDRPVENYLSRWHIPDNSYNKEEVTIRRLLSHTAGLSLHGYPGYPKGEKMPTLEESLNGKNNVNEEVKLVKRPGSQFQYSGGGYTLLQLVVEEITGQTYSEFMKNEILNPLDMNDSLYALQSDEVRNLAVGYEQTGEAYPILSFRELAAAGLHTSVVDFSKFVAALINDEDENQPAGRNILSEESLNMMFTPVMNRYGLGFLIVSNEDHELITHGGTNFGYQSNFYMNRKSGDGIVILTNSDSGHKMIQEMINRIVEWENINQSSYKFGFELIM